MIDSKIEAKLEGSISFPTKSKALDFIPYHHEDGIDPLQLPENNYSVDDCGVALYENPITGLWINN